MPEWAYFTWLTSCAFYTYNKNLNLTYDWTEKVHMQYWNITASRKGISRQLLTFSTLSNCGVVSNKRTGYYIGLFGHYIRNYILFNKNI